MSRLPTAVRKVLLYCRAKEELQEAPVFLFLANVCFSKFGKTLFPHIMRIFL